MNYARPKNFNKPSRLLHAPLSAYFVYPLLDSLSKIPTYQYLPLVLDSIVV